MSSKANYKADALLARFVNCFPKFDYGVLDEAFDFEAWKKRETDPRQLDALLAKLPAGLPPLYERLVVSYRWEEIDLELCTLLANPVGPDLSGLLQQMSCDSVLWAQLTRGGYIPFAKGSRGDYDPVCFDLKSRRKNRDCKVVKVDHEEILCHSRIRIESTIAPSFEALVIQIIALAEKT